MMESIDSVRNFSKSLFTAVIQLKHKFNFLRSSLLTFHVQTSACVSFTFACHDHSAERTRFYGTSRLRVIS